MLTNLHVKDLALIRETEISLDNGLNIITGETGAGKSIIIGSINYCLGEKADKDVIRQGAEYALIELVFHIDKEAVFNRIKEMELPIEEDGMLILTRKIMPGRSVLRVCGETVTAKQMKELASMLIDIHGQHEHQSLLSEKRQLEILDGFGGEELDEIRTAINTAYTEYRNLLKEREELSIDDEKRERELSLARFEVEEIENASLRPGEEDELQDRYNELKDFGKVTAALGQAYDILCNNEHNALEEIGNAMMLLRGLSGNSQVQTISDMACDAENIVHDLAREINEYLSNMNFDEAEFAEIESRMDEINHLELKYGSNIDRVLEYLENRKTELQKLENLASYLEELDVRIEALSDKLNELSDKAHSIRVTTAKALSKSIIAVLEDMNFLQVNFDIEINRREHFDSNGADDVSFVISLNPGEAMKPISKIASGGELSRIMLALKTVLAANDDIDTMIFDEIDTGISGKTAWKVSARMSELGKERQVIAITHLPQIAAMADTHFRIWKHESDGKTETEMARLEDDDVISELARLLGADEVSEASLENARELKAQALEVKKKAVEN